ncbi:MAG: hypothetical protein RL508_98 [Actinomycetota bacterium]|jgi:hypothetical protein
MTKPIDPTEHLKVVAGNPTAEELAVVVSVLQAAAAASAAEQAKTSRAVSPASSWHQNINTLRGSVVPGHGQWQASYRRGLN